MSILCLLAGGGFIAVKDVITVLLTVIGLHVNWFDEEFHWNVPYHNYLVGVASHHHNRYE